MTSPYPEINVVRFAAYLAALAGEIRKARSGERSRLKLLAAAARLLETVNYRDLLVEQVCQEAGVAKGTFYIYFPAKDAFLRDLASRYIGFEGQTYPRLSSRNSAFANMRRWVWWYEKTFAANVGILKCMVQMGGEDAAMAAIWRQRNSALVDRSMDGWLKSRPDSDAVLQRAVLRTAGTMIDQSLFERHGVQPGPGIELPDDPDFAIDLHALMMFRAAYGRNPPAEEFAPETSFRRMLDAGL